jgi:pteridine reductase
MSLRGKVALVTGAGRRVGGAIAVALAEAGADLVLHMHTSAGEGTVRAAEALGRNVTVLRGDLSQPGGAVRVAREAGRCAGRVDIVVNNAGVFLPTPLPDLPLPVWRHVLGVNLTAPFVLALYLGRGMRGSGGGSLVQVGDWLGQRPAPGYAAYCVSKAGLHALTRALAKALAPQVRVNEVVLGPVLPPESYDARRLADIAAHTPVRRVGGVGEVTRVVRFLVEARPFLTGAS